MKTVTTFNSFHLGDNLVDLHFLRKLSAAHPDISFLHAAPDAHLAQLSELVDSTVPNLTLEPLSTAGNGGRLNLWRGSNGWCYRHPAQHDWLRVNLDWYAHLCTLLGLQTPFRTASDFLFDYPALHAGEYLTPQGGIPYFLVINSPPLSGQFTGFSHDAFDQIIGLLVRAGHNVITTSPSRVMGVPCTQDLHYTVTQIGRLSQQNCPHILGVPTGPVWPTFNIWNVSTVKTRILLLDHERVDIAPGTIHCNSLSLVPEILKNRGRL